MASHKKSVVVVEYDSVFTYDHLFQAFYHCRGGKRYRQTVIDFEVNLERKLTKMYRQLKHHRYKTRDLYAFTIYEPKKRDIVANQFADKLIQWIDCEYILKPTISPMLIFDNYASQPYKGTDLARDRLTKFYHQYWNMYHNNDGFVLRCDIKSYFGSIDREILLELVRKLPIDDECLRMLRNQIYAYNPEDSVGVCIGFQSMQWLAVFYLNELDHYIKEELHIKWYGRYMDDFYLVHPDKVYLQYCYKKIKEYVEKKRYLKLNPKSGITRLNTNMNWLGFQFKLSESGRVSQKVTKKSLSRYIKRVDKYIRMYIDDELELINIIESIESWKAHIDHATNNKKLKKYLKSKILDICAKYDLDPDLISNI